MHLEIENTNAIGLASSGAVCVRPCADPCVNAGSPHNTSIRRPLAPQVVPCRLRSPTENRHKHLLYVRQTVGMSAKNKAVLLCCAEG